MVNRAIMAGVITLSIFIAGFSIGSLWESMRSEQVQKELNEMSVYSTSLLLQSELLEGATCLAYQPIIGDATKDLQESLDKYNKYTEGSFFGMDDGNLLYRRYLLSNVKYWMFADKYKKQCDWNTSIILYFFEGDCGSKCDAMSTRLDYMKRKYQEDVLIFPVNLGLAGNDPVAKTLVHLYNVSSYPTVVVDKSIYHVLELNELEALICQEINC